MHLRSISLLAALLLATSSLTASAEQAVVESRQITQFRNGSEETRFGPFEFLGGIEMNSPDERLFGAWSGLRTRGDGRNFVGVLDTGHWIWGALERDASGRISGLSGVSMEKMLNASGGTDPGKSRMDAESLALRQNDILVGFEQWHRVDVYSGSELSTSRPRRSLPLPFPTSRLRGNGGLEALAVAPSGSPLKGAAVAIAEKSVDKNGRLYAGILDGPLKGAFSVVRRDDYDVTDGAFLANGDMLLLQRRFSLATGVAMRIARIPAGDIRPGAVIEPQILLEAGSGYQIDNMEGLDVFTGPDGSTRIILVSDDNHSILQRNLMLEFRLLQ